MKDDESRYGNIDILQDAGDLTLRYLKCPFSVSWSELVTHPETNPMAASRLSSELGAEF
jgi:hypothetical protein